jgi:hypothetical protein
MRIGGKVLVVAMGVNLCRFFGRSRGDTLTLSGIVWPLMASLASLSAVMDSKKLSMGELGMFH